MPEKTKKILIESESHEIFIVRADGKSEVRGYCEHCAAEMRCLTLDETVTHTGIPATSIIRLIQTGQVHFLETLSGHLLICLESVKPFGKKEKESAN